GSARRGARRADSGEPRACRAGARARTRRTLRQTMTIPLLPGLWKPLSPGHAAGFALRLARLLARPRTHDALAPHHALSSLRALPLSFYPGWALVEGEAAVDGGVVGTFDVLYGPGLMWVIDGDSQVLHDLNAGRVPHD